ncbi:ArdC family protein [Bacillus pseudomycoides]|uniref:ArdC family protein n=1 Tax=Bacillus pseudomycoides TaxID=64104 RepID=UPI000BF192A9|nr:ArdC family protein [Bacillus pseudomycoides]PEM69300.1 hypothetical protein CN619_21430 [Bacillus pseudomycoides]PGA62235.1 hypothetical protein COL84_13775 [Bacillus pseudomycoides]
MAEFNSSKEKLKAVHDLLNNSLEDMFKNNDSFKRFLEVMSRLPNYSINNLALIYGQKPEASMVQGFQQWKKIGRYVQKGQKGLYIYAPKHKVTKEIIRDKNGDPVKDENGEDKVKATKKLVGFTPVKVFDVSQTGGQEIPRTQDFVHAVKTGQKNMDYEKLYKLVKDSIQSNAKVPVNDIVNTDYLEKNPSVKGYYNIPEHYIVVRNDLPIEHKFKTLIHEFAHSQLHSKTSPFKDAPRNEKEIHAESVAFCVSNYYGLDTSHYSVGYIATWAQDLEKAKQGLADIQKMVAGTVKSIDNIIEKHKLEILIDNVNEKETKQPEGIVKVEDTNISNIQAESLLEIYNQDKQVEQLKDDKEAFTSSVPIATVEHFKESMDISKNDYLPYFELLDKKSMTFFTGQFIQSDSSKEGFELQIQGGKVVTQQEFEKGDYLITNLLSKGKNINEQTLSFDDQFFIDKNDDKYHISVYTSDGNKENIGSNEDLKVVKSQYDYMAIDKSYNQIQFANDMMKRVDLIMNREIRNDITNSYSSIDRKSFQEDVNTLNRHFHDVQIPNDRRVVVPMVECLRDNPSINSLNDLQHTVGQNQEVAKRLGMNERDYDVMLIDAIGRVVDNTIGEIKSNLTTVEQVDEKTLVLTREREKEQSYISALHLAETSSKGKESTEHHYESYLNDKLRHLLEISKLDSSLTINKCDKVLSKQEVPSYRFNAKDGNGEKDVLIADCNGNFPYFIQKDKGIDLKEILQNTSGVQVLTLPERESRVGELLEVSQKKEDVVER